MKYALFFLLLFASLLKAETITVVADEWCPYNCTDDGNGNQGFLIDIVTAVFGKIGYNVHFISSDSWEKAVKSVRAHKYDAIIGASREEVPDFIFPTIPLAYSYDILLVSKELKWEYSSIDAFPSLVLGGVKGYVYDDEISEYISRHENNASRVQLISGKGTLKYNLKKLKYKKITALIDDQLSIKYFYHQRKKAMPFKTIKRFETYPLHIAFSPNNYKSKKYSELLKMGLKKLRGSHEMHQILKKYGLKEKDILSPAR